MSEEREARTWIITGASSGLGLALAEAALQAGERVAGTARRAERFEGRHSRGNQRRGAADLRRYVALADEGPATEPERREMMLAHRDQIRQRLRELALALEATEYKIASYGGAPGDRCS